MNKEEIVAMEAGRELDVLVAKEVFGIEVEWDYSPWNINKQEPKMPFLKGEPRTCLGPMAHPVANTICEYSTDISPAHQVVMKDGAWDIKKRFRPHRDDPPGSSGRPTYQALCFLSDYDEYEDELVNKRAGKSPWCWTLPEAICKAALLAKFISS